MSRRSEISLTLTFGALFVIAADKLDVPFPLDFLAGAFGIVFVVAVYRWLQR